MEHDLNWKTLFATLSTALVIGIFSSFNTYDTRPGTVMVNYVKSLTQHQSTINAVVEPSSLQNN